MGARPGPTSCAAPFSRPAKFGCEKVCKDVVTATPGLTFSCWPPAAVPDKHVLARLTGSAPACAFFARPPTVDLDKRVLARLTDWPACAFSLGPPQST